jgi:hypothetical protein
MQMTKPRTATLRKIWEIDRRFHCGLIGTCLSLTDLHKLCRRAGIQFQTAVSDYDLHHAFVDIADHACHASRLLQRQLNDRHRASLRRFAGAPDEEALARLWEDALESGDIAGAYWALMSHPLAGVALCDRAAGEVHMLSHLAGATHRHERQQLKQLQQRQRLLEQWLHEERNNNAEQQAIIKAFNERLTRARNAETELARLRTRIQQLEHGEALQLARTRNENLAASLAQSRLAAERHSADAQRWAERCRDAEQAAAQTTNELAAVSAERDSLEHLIRNLTRNCAQDCSADCPRFDLCRRRILYVGGRPTLSPHLRQLVEHANGEFLHHDGGREEADSALAALLPGADAVLCPADCISHSAMLRIKRVCKQQAKPFLILRSASLSAFARGLQQLLNGNSTLTC